MKDKFKGCWHCSKCDLRWSYKELLADYDLGGVVYKCPNCHTEIYFRAYKGEKKMAKTYSIEELKELRNEFEKTHPMGRVGEGSIYFLDYLKEREIPVAKNKKKERIWEYTNCKNSNTKKEFSTESGRFYCKYRMVKEYRTNDGKRIEVVPSVRGILSQMIMGLVLEKQFNCRPFLAGVREMYRNPEITIDELMRIIN